MIVPMLIVMKNTEYQMKAMLQPNIALMECSATGGTSDKKAAHFFQNVMGQAEDTIRRLHTFSRMFWDRWKI
jgi:hypothetical protein